MDLRETPIVEWSWGIAAAYDHAVDEATRAGDDFPARLSLIRGGGLNPMRSRAVTYVWASARPVGSNWINPYVEQTRIVVARSGAPDPSRPWKTERRNLREDFRRYLDLEVDTIDAVAIMTDCDDRTVRADAWYGAIRFLPEGAD